MTEEKLPPFGDRKVPNSQNKPTAQAAGHTLPDTTPPKGKIRPFRKMAVTFETLMQFGFRAASGFAWVC